MQEINTYFNGLVFKKSEMFPTYTLYVALVRTYEENSVEKYILVYVMNKDAKLDEMTYLQLSNKWFAIKSTDNYSPRIKLRLQQFLRSFKDGISNNKTYTIVERYYEHSIYSNDIDKNIELTLLHNEKLHSRLQYPDKLSLHLCVDTYKCIIRRKMI